MIRAVILEPDSALRGLLRVHFSSESESLYIAATLEEAQRAQESAEVVVVRASLDPDLSAAYPCAFELEAASTARRLVVLAGAGNPAGRAASLYLQELDRILALRSFPPAIAPEDNLAGVPPDFPLDFYQPLLCCGRFAAASVMQVRERITDIKGYVVQVDDAHPEAPVVTRALYGEFGARGAYGAMLRHEYTALRSFIHTPCLPTEVGGLAPSAGFPALPLAS